MVLPMLAVSCKKSHDEPQPEILLQKSEVPAAAGSQFVSVKATGKWTISLSEDWATVEPSEGTGSKSTIVLNFSANPSETSRMLEIVVESAGGRATAEMTQTGVTEHGGGQGSATATASWLELPETKADDGYDFFTHSMSFEGKTVRNYSYYWDYDNLLLGL